VPVTTSPATKTFLLGAGCQKGGTTWLFRYLKSSPQYVRGYMKEYHVFDALDLESEQLTRKRILRKATEAVTAVREGGKVNAMALHRMSMYGNPQYYYDYFAGILTTRPGGRVTADMTPDYGMLPASRFREIRTAFDKRGVRTVSVFLMRDPVQRIWSHLRMQAQRFPTMFDRPLPEVLLERHTDDNYALRTRYDRTLAALDDAFERDELYLGFYEQLFTERSTREICALLGIDYVDPDFDVRRNASAAPPDELPEDTVRTVAAHFSEVYDAVATRLPDVDLEALWPSARYAR
jgi:hypothetical protein